MKNKLKTWFPIQQFKCDMLLKLYSPFPLGFFPHNLIAISDEHGKRFYQKIAQTTPLHKSTDNWGIREVIQNHIRIQQSKIYYFNKNLLFMLQIII